MAEFKPLIEVKELGRMRSIKLALQLNRGLINYNFI